MAFKNFVIAIFVASAGIGFAVDSQAGVAVYDSTQAPLPGNVVSLGFQATSTDEFGDYIQFTSGSHYLDSATVTMSNWAKFSDYSSNPLYSGNNSTWTHDLTLNLYNVDLSGPNPVIGSLIYSTTQTAVIPWHDSSNGFNGTAFNFTFALPNVLVPNEIIFGIAYNTQTHGAAPLGAAGPYNSLNVGLNAVAGPSIGTDVDPDAVFWDTSVAGFYADNGVGGTDTFRLDPEWGPYVPAVQFTATPEPTTAMIWGLGVLGVSIVGRFRRQRAAR